MSIEVSGYINLAAKAAELKCEVPAELALLPRNFATARFAAEFFYDENVPAIRSELRMAGLNETSLRKGYAEAPVVRAAADHRAHLTVFFGSPLLERDARGVTLVLGTIACVLSERSAGRQDIEGLRFEAIVERRDGRGYARVTYEGDACSLPGLSKSVREAWSGIGPTDADHFVAWPRARAAGADDGVPDPEHGAARHARFESPPRQAAVARRPGNRTHVNAAGVSVAEALWPKAEWDLSSTTYACDACGTIVHAECDETTRRVWIIDPTRPVIVSRTGPWQTPS